MMYLGLHHFLTEILIKNKIKFIVELLFRLIKTFKQEKMKIYEKVPYEIYWTTQPNELH